MRRIADGVARQLARPVVKRYVVDLISAVPQPVDQGIQVIEVARREVEVPVDDGEDERTRAVGTGTPTPESRVEDLRQRSRLRRCGVCRSGRGVRHRGSPG